MVKSPNQSQVLPDAGNFEMPADLRTRFEAISYKRRLSVLAVFNRPSGISQPGGMEDLPCMPKSSDGCTPRNECHGLRSGVFLPSSCITSHVPPSPFPFHHPAGCGMQWLESSSGPRMAAAGPAGAPATGNPADRGIMDGSKNGGPHDRRCTEPGNHKDSRHAA